MEPQEEGFSLVHAISSWILALFAVSYSTGFLVVFSFLNRFGIREAAADFFKIKYVLVGTLYLSYPVCVGVPVLSFLYRDTLIRHRPPTDEPDSALQSKLHRLLDIPAVLLVTNLSCVLFLIVAFATPDFVLNRQHAVLTLLSLTLAGLLVLSFLQRLVQSESRAAALDRMDKRLAHFVPARFIKVATGALLRCAKWSMWLLMGILVALDRWFLSGLGSLLKEMVWGGGYRFLLLMALIAYVVWRCIRRVSRYRTDTGRRTVVIALTASLVGALSFISTLSFAYWVYPYIPAERGGGDYTDAREVVIMFGDKASVRLPPGMARSSCNCSKPLLILDATASSVFVADPKDGGGPMAWRREGRPAIQVVEIQRDLIGSVLYARPDARGEVLAQGTSGPQGADIRSAEERSESPERKPPARPALNGSHKGRQRPEAQP
jgi:hypothetical protein